MADGSRKKIRDIRVGDQVLATDPQTGQTGPRTVTALIVGHGMKDLVDITVTTPDGPAVLTATGGYPFWDQTDHAWVDAGDLTAADRLRTPAGQLMPIAGENEYQRVDTVSEGTVESSSGIFLARARQLD